MHIANITSASLDDLIEPLDLAQTPADVVVLSFSESDLRVLASAYDTGVDDTSVDDTSADGTSADGTSVDDTSASRIGASALPSMRLAALRNLRHPMSVDLWIDSVAAHARVILVRLLGGYDWWPYGCDQLAQIAKRNKIALAILPGECRDRDERLTALSTIDTAELDALLACFREGGAANMSILLKRLARLSGRDIDVRCAEPVPRMGFYQPGAGVVPLDRFSSAANGGSAVVPILFYRSMLLADDTAPIEALAAALSKRGLTPVPLFVPTLKSKAVARFLNETANTLRPAVLVTTTAFAAGLGTASTTLFEDIGVPVFQAIIATTRFDAWQASDNGLGTSDLAMNVVLPELDGRILAGALSFKDFANTGQEFGTGGKESLTSDEGLTASDESSATCKNTALDLATGPLEFTAQKNRHAPNRVSMIADRVAAMIELQRTRPADRRLMIIMPDYPGAEGRMGYAVGLDVPTSILAILDDLKEAGYDVGDALPEKPRDLLQSLARPRTALGRNFWPDAFAGLPEAAQDKVVSAWGTAPAGAFSFHHVAFGNVTVALAPDRGRFADRRADYHDPSLPPDHALLAFGHWLRHGLGCHAIIHCGAHGTMEWLPGKAVALSQSCFPELVTGHLPVIYPFIVSNPGEAAQAKRRIAAVTLGHMPPPMLGAGLSREQIELERLVDEFVQADGLDFRRRDRLAELILEKAASTGIDKVAGVEAGADQGSALKQIDAWLCDLKDFAIKDGQHVYGRAEPHCTDKLRIESAQSERDGLLTAIDGAFVVPGPAGSPTRGRTDVFPTGRNLFTIDPRMMPTPTAFDMGKAAADEVLRFYMQQHGDWPRRLVIDLWGSASLRTGGEEIAQGLVLMGCRPRWDHATGRVTGIDVLPPASFGRPRVDVTWRISGLFRDMFPAQIALLSAAIEAVAKRPEDSHDNPLADDARASGAPPQRIFGSAPGSYGSGAEDLLAKGDWQSREEIGDAYLAAAAYAFSGPEGAPSLVPGAFAARIETADLLVHTGDDPGRDLLEGAADAAFIGGFAAAQAALQSNADVVTLDTTDPSKPRARSLIDTVTRIIHARAINPRYVHGQMRHGPRGASDFAETVDRLVAFAETTNAIPEALIEAVHDAYIGDRDVRAFMLRENPAAAAAIAKRLATARRRGLWHPRRNSIDNELSQLIDEASQAVGALT